MAPVDWPFGSRVFGHDVMTRESTGAFRCAETADGGGLLSGNSRNGCSTAWHVAAWRKHLPRHRHGPCHHWSRSARLKHGVKTCNAELSQKYHAHRILDFDCGIDSLMSDDFLASPPSRFSGMDAARVRTNLYRRERKLLRQA